MLKTQSHANHEDSNDDPEVVNEEADNGDEEEEDLGYGYEGPTYEEYLEGNLDGLYENY